MAGLIPKEDKRLSDIINKLKRHIKDRDDIPETDNCPVLKKKNNFIEETEIFTKEKASEQLDLPKGTSCIPVIDLTEEENGPEFDQSNQTVKRVSNESNSEWSSKEDKSLSKNYLMWENNFNLCWLNSAMSLLAHNKTLHHFVNENVSQIAHIVKGYESAISVYNDYSNENAIEERLLKSKDILQKIQTTVFEYLEPILKCKKGQPDSAFCCLLNLIKENKQIRNLFLVDFFCINQCTKCVLSRLKKSKKTVITLSKVKAFNPSSPVFLCKCPFCETLDQEVQIKYETLPQCLIFHFENGAGEGNLGSFDFELNGRKYELSGLIKLEKRRYSTINHFVTWTRDITSDRWLERNDLNNDILNFSVVPPVINLQDLYIVMYEALDNKGTVFSVSVDTANINRMDLDDKSSSCIPVIDLTDEEKVVEFDQNNQTVKRASRTKYKHLILEQRLC
ncbi:SUMO-specific isopeptidase USPL1 like protein [Argiope bruennichi]|uniref:SUMO-specific isopeptidase USPL1 like protein n=1 Tax=Argiope bruennichi TaxID=94029 RepID=A0A8T0EU28_ARGBR|nr:SUMO-specific isopeptidase USPL1 like protein [Argiope bruennichi]